MFVNLFYRSNNFNRWPRLQSVMFEDNSSTKVEENSLVYFVTVID